MLRLALALSLVMVVGCAPPPAPAQPTAAPVALKHIVDGMPVTPPNLPHVGAYLARDLGYFQEERLDVEIKSFESGVQVLRGGIAGDIDVVGSSSEPVVAAVAQGATARAGSKTGRRCGAVRARPGDDPSRTRSDRWSRRRSGY